MKLMSSARTLVAAMMRSPSFSRSSSSSMTTISPARTAATMSSVESSAVQAASVFARVPMFFQELHAEAAFVVAAAESLEVASDHVDLNINSVAQAIPADHRDRLRVRYYVDLKKVAAHRIDREAHAVDCDRALLRHVARERLRQLDTEHRRAARGLELHDLADAVDVTLNEVAVERLPELERRLEVDARAGAEPAQRGDGERLG